MKSSILALAAVFSAASAYGQAPAVKPGTSSTVAIAVKIIAESPVLNQPLPNGGSRKTYSVAAFRYSNREVLEVMRVGNLLDGTLVGWSIKRFANASDVGNLYASKAGKAPVAVPATLLTQPVVQGYADAGTLTKANATAPEVANLVRRAYVSLSVRGGASTSSGTQTLKTAKAVFGSQSVNLLHRSEAYNFIGKGATGNTVVSGAYQVSKSTPVNLTPLFPGSSNP